VTGKVAPEMVNPVPVRLAALTVTAELPVEVRVTVCVEGVPTVTLPKLKLVALKVSTGLVALAPVPLRLTVIVEPVEELLAMEREPVSVPATLGSKVTWTLAVWPGDRVSGRAGPATSNPVPATVRALTVTDADPVDCKVMDWVEAEFRVTLPKLRLVVLTLKVRDDR